MCFYALGICKFFPQYRHSAALGVFQALYSQFNVVCGVFEDNKNDNGSMMANSRRRLFLFASGMPEIRFYDDEDAFVLDCAKCDIDGRDLKSFEDCYGTFVSSEENMGVGDVFCDVLKYPYVSGITFDDLLLLLFVFLIWWFICGRFIIKKRLS